MSDEPIATALVKLNWTYGVNVNGRTEYYGPGLVPVPVDVARRKGWQPVTAAEPTGDVGDAALTLAQTASSEPGAAETAVEPMAADVAALAGVPRLVDALEMAGFVTAVSIHEVTVGSLTAVEGVGPKTAAKLKTAAKELLT